MNDLPAYAVARIERGADCWRWTGPRNHFGYGQAMKSGKTQMAHRYVFESVVGPIPDGMDLDHLCHNADAACIGGATCPHRLCVNPSHLEPVTHRENMRRSRNVGKAWLGKRRKSPIVAGIEARYRSSLADVLRSMHASGMKQTDICAALGVSRRAAGNWMREAGITCHYGRKPRHPRTLTHLMSQEKAA